MYSNMLIKDLQGKLEFSFEVTGMYITSISYQADSLVNTLNPYLEKSTSLQDQCEYSDRLVMKDRLATQITSF
jgi:hypothetical protein